MSRGGKREGAGRKPGVPNRTTADVRATIAMIAERNVSRLEKWLDQIAQEDPNKAADLFLRMIEYHIPKLARSEVTGDGGGPVKHEVHIVDPTRRPNDPAPA